MVRVIYLASPLSGDVERNQLYALEAMADSLGRDEAPFVPHLLYTQALDDTDEDDRALGMAAEIRIAESLGIPVFRRFLGEGG